MKSTSWTKRFTQALHRAGDFVLDPSIIFSFDHTGYLRHRSRFLETDLDVDMTNRTCVVTGGNSGLGFETALALAKRKASVWILSRNEARSADKVVEIVNQTGNHDVHHAHLDLSNPRSVATLNERMPISSIDILINNAGVLLQHRELTPDGLDKTLATNLTGHLSLTASLLPQLRAGTAARIIWVSSGGMYAKKLNIDHLYSPPEPFDGVSAYAQTKRAMTVISQELSVQLHNQGIAVHCMHPGWAATPGVEQSLPRFWQLTQPILRPPAAGADTIVWLSVCDKAASQTGLFWFDRKPRPLHLLPHTKHSNEEARLLWERVHQWAGITPNSWGHDSA